MSRPRLAVSVATNKHFTLVLHLEKIEMAKALFMISPTQGVG